MADERDSEQPRESGQAELTALKAERLLIWSALKEETDEAKSALLMQRLRVYHGRISALRESGFDEPDTYENESFPAQLEPFQQQDVLARRPTRPSAPAPEPALPARLALGGSMPFSEEVEDLPFVQRKSEKQSTPVLRLALFFAGGMVVAAGILVLLTFGPLSSDRSAVSAANTVAARTVTTVPAVALDDAEPDEVVGDDETIDASGIVVGSEVVSIDEQRSSDLQRALNRLVAQTPLIFTPGTTALTAAQQRILEGVGVILLDHPEAVVQVVGYTDTRGEDTVNTRVSLRRADSVRAYLVSLGIPEANLRSDARGEATASGSEGLASLERRVEFEVVGPSDAPSVATGGDVLRVAIVTPSARDDLAFSQSMVDAMNAISQQRGAAEITITDNLFVPAEAGDLIRDYATQGYDLVIGHSSTFGAEILKIAPEYPEVAFAYGTGTDNFGLSNVYTYAVNTAEGAFVNGAMSSMLSTTKVIGIVGPLRIPETEDYEQGYTAGALAQTPDAQVLVAYTDSFSDVALAAEAAQAHIAAGADVLTGSSQMVVGAITVAQTNGAAWFGNQSDQSSYAPATVAAAQVYRWDVLLQEVVVDVDSGVLNGRVLTADLANGGLSIVYNDAYPLPPEVRLRGDELIAGIISGTVVVPAG